MLYIFIRTAYRGVNRFRQPPGASRAKRLPNQRWRGCL